MPRAAARSRIRGERDQAQERERALKRALGSLKQRLKQMSTALQLDSGAAISLSQEAQQLFFPVLQFGALSEVRD